MEEFNDSLNSNEAVPGVGFTYNHQLQMQTTNQLIQGLAQSGDVLNVEYGSSVLDFTSDDPAAQGFEIAGNRQVEIFSAPEFESTRQENHFTRENDPGIFEVSHDHNENREIVQVHQGNFSGVQMQSYRRSGPDGSPSFQQSSGFIPGMSNENGSVIFQPRGQLDFSGLDETGQVEEIIPHGTNRSVSTPELEFDDNSVSYQYLERQVCGSHGNNSRENSPDVEFLELKNSPSMSEEELDSRVIFSPLSNLVTDQNTSMNFQSNLTNDQPSLHRRDDRQTVTEQREESEGSASPILSPHQRRPQQTYHRSQPLYQRSQPMSPLQYSQTSPYNQSSSQGHQIYRPSPANTSVVHTSSQMSVNGRSELNVGERREVFVAIPQVSIDVNATENIPPSDRLTGISSTSNYRKSPQRNDAIQLPSRNNTPQKDKQRTDMLMYDQDAEDGQHSDRVLNVRSNSPNKISNSMNNSLPLVNNSDNVNRSVIDSSHSSGVGGNSLEPHSLERNHEMSAQNLQDLVNSSTQGSGLPSPSVWQVPDESEKNSKRGIGNSVFKEPKVPEQRRPLNVPIKRPTMPPKNSQRELVSIQRNRQEQMKRDIQVQQSRVRLQGQDTRSVQYPDTNHQTNSKVIQQRQNQENRMESKLHGNPVEKKARPGMDKKNTSLQKNTTCERYGRTVQGNYSEYERKVEGGTGIARTRYGMENQGMNSGRPREREVSVPVRHEGIGEDSSPHAQHPGLNVVTQVEQHAADPRDHRHKQQKLPDRNSHWSLLSDSSIDVQGMEGVRSQLQNMLKISCDTISGTAGQYNHNDPVSGLFLDMPQEPFLYESVIDSSLRDRTVDEVNDMTENFPSFSRMWTDSTNVSRNDVSIHAENQRLRDLLEKERYRRKHCEQHIQKLNVKLLETQQQVAVAVSTDKRKDIMIEQLDKQLAKVVEGWKRRDDEKKDYIDQIQKEKSAVEDKLVKQSKMIENFEVDMAKAVEELRKEKEEAVITIEKLRTEVDEKERNRAVLEDQLQGEKEKADIINQEWEKVKETRELGDRKVQQLQDRLHKEQDEWFKREQELLQRIEEVTENNMKIMQQERHKCEEQEGLIKEIEDKIQSNQTEMKRLEMELDASDRAKESMKVEMGIMEAKFESAQRTLEAELHSQMQKEIAAQMTEVHKKFEEEEGRTREAHRKTVKEISQRHAKETEKQLARFHDDLKTREEEHRRVCQEYEDKLHESRAEITSLQATRQKLETQRSETLVKLQYMMQSQWNEAVTLLTATPQRKNMLNSSFTSQLPTESQMFNSSVLSQPASLPVMPSHSTFDSPGKTSAPAGHNNQATINHSQESQAGYTHDNPITAVSLKEDDITSGHRNLATVNSPGKDSVAADHNPPVLTDSNHSTGFTAGFSLADFNSSLQMQQLIQSLSHPDVPVVHNIPTSLPEKPEPISYRTEINSVNQECPPVQSLQHSHINSIVMDSHGTNHMSHIPHMSYANEAGQTSNHSVHKWLHDSSGLNVPQAQNSHFIGGEYRADHRVTNQNIGQQLPVAVAIRPPQQHSTDINNTSESSYHRLNNSRHSQGSGGSDSLAYPGKHSPPTKQSRSRLQEEQQADDDDDDMAAVLNDSTRLTSEYRQISDRLKEHETRQGQLQHYIQMLLQKAPGGSTDDGDLDPENVSLFSHDQTEDFDMNDTAQAAQLQQELARIQQLREKQTAAVPPQEVVTEQQTGGSSAQGNSLPGILNQEQLAEISRYLAQHQEALNQPQDMGQISDLVDAMKNLQTRLPKDQMGHPKQQGRRPDPKYSPRSVPPSSRDLARVKKNLKSQMAGVAQPDGSQGDKSVTIKTQQGQPKKIDRKVASVGGAGGGAGVGPKPGPGKTKSAWK